MEERLMDREVLCILDTRQIQRFMFRSNTMADTIGGSDLVKHVLDDAIRHALGCVDPPLAAENYDLSMDPDADIPYFHDPGVLFQLINSSAGNALFIARTGALAQQVIRMVSRYYLEHAHSLDLAAAAVEKTDVMGHDIFELYRRLNAVKASSETLEPLGCLPVCMIEDGTGQPVVGFDDDAADYVSTSSIIRRREASKRDFLFRMDDINTTLGHDGQRYRAVLHADGNNLGITIGRIAQNASDYESGIRTRRAINRGIQGTMGRVMDQTLADLAGFHERVTGSAEGFEREFQVIHQGGDDINCVCNASLAPTFLYFLYKNLEGACFWRSESLTLPLYVCAGVVFVTEDCAYHPAFSLAEECCSSAKKAAKEERHMVGGLAANWVDFQVLDNPRSQNLDMLRERSYTVGMMRPVSLLERPFFVGPGAGDSERSVRRLLRRVRTIRGLGLSGEEQAALRQSYLAGSTDLTAFVANMRAKGCDLVELLGEPLRTDDDGDHATWFDAADVADFVTDEFVDLLDMDERGGDREGD